jgi:hypothetical protein
MPKWAACKRRDFVKKLRQLGFDGPIQARDINSCSLRIIAWQFHPAQNMNLQNLIR